MKGVECLTSELKNTRLSSVACNGGRLVIAQIGLMCNRGEMKLLGKGSEQVVTQVRMEHNRIPRRLDKENSIS